MRQEEVRECCEGWLQEAEVPRLCKALGLGAAPAPAGGAKAPLGAPAHSLGYPSEAAEAGAASEPDSERPPGGSPEKSFSEMRTEQSEGKSKGEEEGEGSEGGEG